MVTAEFATMKDIGALRGISSHEVGNALKKMGLRTPGGKPSAAAINQGLARQQWYEGNEIYGWFWCVEKVSRRLDEAGLANK